MIYKCVFWVVIYFLPTLIEEPQHSTSNICIADELDESQWRGI